MLKTLCSFLAEDLPLHPPLSASPKLLSCTLQKPSGTVCHLGDTSSSRSTTYPTYFPRSENFLQVIEAVLFSDMNLRTKSGNWHSECQSHQLESSHECIKENYLAKILPIYHLSRKEESYVKTEAEIGDHLSHTSLSV